MSHAMYCEDMKLEKDTVLTFKFSKSQAQPSWDVSPDWAWLLLTIRLDWGIETWYEEADMCQRMSDNVREGIR